MPTADSQRAARGILVLAVVLAMLVLKSTIASTQPSRPPLFSTRAQAVWEDPNFQKHSPVEVRSPDGKVVVTFPPYGNQQPPFVRVEAQVVSLDLDGNVQPYILWAPDSSAFLITVSEGGANGLYSTKLVSFHDQRVATVPLTENVRQAYLAYRQKQGIVCSWPEDPNIFGIRWMSGSSRALIAAQTISHSVCDSFGTFRAYEIGVPSGKIIKIYDQILAKRVFWSDLGVILRGADDGCIRNPRSCRVRR